jgi:hypothetical protein
MMQILFQLMSSMPTTLGEGAIRLYRIFYNDFKQLVSDGAFD